ncbi:MAG: Mut7-C RNAse domain-containing protein [Candidatus Lokiarchaeota archaeon]|nr:Mut7-C RNAse domain-containing protein [Candidatus Lokiarchaeota archaeon]
MKFLIDAMLGRLARFLRIFGYDTIYANDLEKVYKIDSVPDDILIEYAKETDRIIITKDYPLYERFENQCIFLEGEDVYGYLNQLRKKLVLNYEFNMEKAHCSVCNSSLEEVSDKNLIKDRIKNETFKYYNEFFQCVNPNCKKVFWDGPHIKNIKQKLKENLNN